MDLDPSGQVQPVGPLSVVRLARVHVHRVVAVPALHGAAPAELALALGGARDAHGVVAPAAAHDLAAVGAPRRLVAHAARRAQRACRRKEREELLYL